MSRLVRVSIVMAMMASAAWAQEAPPAEAAEEEGHAPNIVCEEPTFQFGERDQSDTVEHTFTVRNDGDLTLEIGRVRTSCGCTVANVSTKQVAPGEEATVTARLSLKNRRGKQRKTITVESNDPDTPRYSLYLEGTATSLIQVEPTRVFFGQIDEDEEKSATVKITSKLDVPLNITKVESTSKSFSYELNTIEEGKNYEVVVSTVNPLPRGSQRTNIRVTTDNPRYPVIDVSVSATVLDELMVAPTQIVLPAKEGEKVSRYIVVRPGKTKTFEIGEIELPDEGMKSSITALGQNGYQIKLDQIPSIADLNGKKVVIHTDAEGMDTIEVPFRILPAKPSS